MEKIPSDPSDTWILYDLWYKSTSQWEQITLAKTIRVFAKWMSKMAYNPKFIDQETIQKWMLSDSGVHQVFGVLAMKSFYKYVVDNKFREDNPTPGLVSPVKFKNQQKLLNKMKKLKEKAIVENRIIAQNTYKDSIAEQPIVIAASPEPSSIVTRMNDIESAMRVFAKACDANFAEQRDFSNEQAEKLDNFIRSFNRSSTSLISGDTEKFAPLETQVTDNSDIVFALLREGRYLAAGELKQLRESYEARIKSIKKATRKV